MNIVASPSGNNDLRGVWSRWLTMAFFASLVVIPVAYYGLNNELAHWKAAAARSEVAHGDPIRALDLLEAAVKQSPHDLSLKLQWAECLMNNGRAEQALDLIQEVSENASNPRPAWQLQGECYLELNRPDDALAVTKKFIDRLSPTQANRPTHLNHLAYYRALAGVESEEAEKDIDLAIKGIERNLWWLDSEAMPLEDITLLSTVVVARSIGRQADVLAAMDERILFCQDRLKRLDDQFSTAICDAMDAEVPFSDNKEAVVQKRIDEIQAEKQFLAHYFAVRGLLYEDLKRPVDSLRDREEAKRLGHDAFVLLEQLPDDWDMLNLTRTGAVFLDTRAMVRALQGRVGLAMRDFDIAILAAEVINMSFRSTIQNTVRNESGQAFTVSECKELEAVLRKHRLDQYALRGREQSVIDEWKRIKELGFNEQDPLY